MTEQESQEHQRSWKNKQIEFNRNLVREAIVKLEKERGKPIERNWSLENYKPVAAKLNEILGSIPKKSPDDNVTANEEEEDESNAKANEREINPWQIRRALLDGAVNLKPYLYKALYWYLYEKHYEKGETQPAEKFSQVAYENLLVEKKDYENEIEDLNGQLADAGSVAGKYKKQSRLAWIVAGVLLIALVTFALKMGPVSSEAIAAKSQSDSIGRVLTTLRQDMHLLPYQPTQAEINQLEGVYLVYTASPQARASDPDRYHKVVANILVVNYKDGYFTFDRYGHDFDQKGYMQFEDSNLLSMHSYMIGDLGKRSPKKTLIPLEQGRDTFSVISTSWSFDPNPLDNINIGIREVFIKIGQPGSITQIVNSPRNFGKAGKLFDLKTKDGTIKTIHIQNERLESLAPALQVLLNEESILLKDPDPAVLLKKTSKK